MDSRWAVVVLPCYAIAAAALVALRLPPAVAAVCVAPLVLLAPGYALVLALDIPSRAELPGHRFVLSIALSVATTALGGLIVNALAPLTAASWTIWLVAFTCACSLAAFLRAPERPSLSSARRASRGDGARRTRQLPWQRVGVGALVLVLLAGAVVLTELNSRSAYDKPLTQLSLLPSAGSSGRKLRLSIGNLSSHTERLTLTLARRRRPSTMVNVVIPAAHTWSREEPGYEVGLNAWLTKPGQRQPFSEVSWSGTRRVPARRHRRAARARHRRARLRKAQAG
jgi:hypothetical protein